MGAYHTAKDLLTRCLAARLPAALRDEIVNFLERPAGRPRKADPVQIAAMLQQGRSVVEIAAALGCHETAVRAAMRRSV